MPSGQINGCGLLESEGNICFIVSSMLVERSRPALVELIMALTMRDGGIFLNRIPMRLPRLMRTRAAIAVIQSPMGIK
jgi:hypothetical protein